MATQTSSSLSPLQQDAATAGVMDKSNAYKTRRSFTSSRRRKDSSASKPIQDHDREKMDAEQLRAYSKSGSGAGGFFSAWFRGASRSRSTSRAANTAPVPQHEFTPSFSFTNTPATTTTTTTTPTFAHPSENSLAPKFSQIPFTPADHRSLAKSRTRNNSVDQSTLYLAYEKAIKASQLIIPTVQAEIVLKHNKDLKDWQSTEKRPRFGKKSFPLKALDLNWTQKLFLLVPGYVLQYNGDVSNHRDPEKMLKLSAESVTFATDVLDGKHWVLQVNSYRDGALHPQSRTGLLAKFSTRSRLDASVLLLVFESAEEMQDWLVKIRNEISRLGGKTIEEHPLAKSQPKAIVEEEESRARTTESEDRHSDTSSSRCFSRTSRPSEDIAASMSTAISRDEMMLDDLRGSRTYLAYFKASRSDSSETSPERSSDTATTRTTRPRSNTLGSMAMQSSSAEVRLARSRPTSPMIDAETASQMTTERAPSPSMTQVSTSSYHPRRSSLVPSTPIPVPTAPRRGSESADSAFPLYAIEVSKRKPRQRRKSSQPLSNDSGYFTPLSTSLPNHHTPSPIEQHVPKQRPRPVSMATAPMPRRMTSTDNMAAFAMMNGQTSPGGSIRSRNLKRRSMGTLSGPVGPPMHPPPSAPLPKLPGSEFYFDIEKGSSTSLVQIPPVPPIPTSAIIGQAKIMELRQLNTRHSFHTIRIRDTVTIPTSPRTAV